MKEYLPIIKNSPLFSGINDEEIYSILTCLEAKKDFFNKDEFILRTGQNIDSIGLILNGSAFIIQEDFWGNRNLIAQFTQGQIFAEAFACSSGSFLNVSVTAKSNCEIMWLNVKRILTVCSSACPHHIKIIRSLLSEIAKKNLTQSEKLTHMGQRTTREKLLSYLSAQSMKKNSSEFDIEFNRQQLADYLSVERSAMSAELSKLRDEGFLKFNRSHFILLSKNISI